MLDLRSAPAAFFKNGTFQKGSEVYNWYKEMMGRLGSPLEKDIVKGSLTTKWTNKEIIWQEFTEYADETRLAWQQVWVGSFGSAGKNMNGRSEKDYQAYHHWMAPVGVLEDAKYKSTGGFKVAIKGGIVNATSSESAPTMSPDIWSKYFESFFHLIILYQ